MVMLLRQWSRSRVATFPRSVKMASLRAAVVASAMVFTTVLASASLAGPVEHVPYVGLGGAPDSSLVLQVKSEHRCKWKRVCDYFAPATSCSHPPCCKKSHHEKVCEDTTSDKGTPPAPAPAPAPAPKKSACFITKAGQGSGIGCASNKSSCETLTNGDTLCCCLE